MQQLKKQLKLGNVQLAKLNQKQQAVPMQLGQLQQKQQRMNKQGLIIKKLKQLSPQQKQQWVHLKKLHAKQLFKCQKWDQAIEYYLEAMLGLDIDSKNQQKLRHINEQMKYPIMLNIVTCMFKKKQYKTAVQLCNRILGEKHGKNNIKAIFKKANCLMAMGQYKLARESIAVGMKLVQLEYANGGRSDITRQDFIKIIKELKVRSDVEKDMYRKIFVDDQEVESQPLMEGKQKGGYQQTLVYKQSLRERLVNCCRESYRSFVGALNVGPSCQKVD